MTRGKRSFSLWTFKGRIVGGYTNLPILTLFGGIYFGDLRKLLYFPIGEKW